MILKENIDVLLFILGWIGILWVFVLYVVVVQYVCGVGVVLDWYVFRFLCGTGVVCSGAVSGMLCCCFRYRVFFLWFGVVCFFESGIGVVFAFF